MTKASPLAKRTCECGTCNKCKHREYMRRWYRQPGSASRVRAWAKRYRAQNLDRVREYDNSRKKGQPRDLAKERARAAINHAVANGLIQRPHECQRCGAGAVLGIDGRTLIQAHHHDYTKPFEVVWLCVSCHGIAHRKVA